MQAIFKCPGTPWELCECKKTGSALLPTITAVLLSEEVCSYMKAYILK